MSIPAMMWAVEHQDLPLDKRTGKPSPACAAVLSCLAWHASDEGTDSFPSVARICRHTKYSERNVQLALASLEDHGTIRRTPDPLRRSQTITDPRHQPVSWDLVPMLRGANSDVQGCKVEESRGAKSSTEDQQEFAPKRSYNPTQPMTNERQTSKRSKPSSPSTPDGVATEADDPDLFGASTTAEDKKNASHVVQAWFDGYAKTGVKPPGHRGPQVGAEAKRLIKAGNDVEVLIKAAFAAGELGWYSIERQLTAAARNGQGPRSDTRGSSVDDLRGKTDADYAGDPFEQYRREMEAEYGPAGTR